MSFQRRTWEVLDASRSGDRLARVFGATMLLLIALNILAVVLETVPSIGARYSQFFLWFERVSVAVFSLEYLARVWAAPIDSRYGRPIHGRLRFMVTPLALIDLFAVLPFFLPMIGVDLRFMRALRLLRLFRIAKAARYVVAMRLLRAVIYDKREELVLTTSILVLMLIIAASLMYFVESAVQPKAFSSIPAAMWWAASTMTTVGYGDIYPITSVGRLLAACVAVMGVGLFALPTAILASGFAEAVAKSKQPSVCPHCGKELVPTRSS